MSGLRTAETSQDGDTAPDRSVVVCGVQRVGTTLLCDLMTSTDRLGYPKEFFLPQARQAFLGGWDLPTDTDDRTFLQRALRNGTSPNRVFGVKLMADQLPTFHAMTDGRGLDALPRHHLVWLRRRDLLAAAVSQLVAEATGRWSSSRATHPPMDPREADLDRLDELHGAKHEQEDLWAQALVGRPVLQAWYEDWTDDPGGLVARLAADVGVDLDGASPRSGLRRQRSEVNAAIEARWRADGGTCPRCDRAAVCAPQPVARACRGGHADNRRTITMAETETGPKAGIKGAVEDAKGKAKEAAGVVTGDRDLEQEGEAQQEKADAQEDVAQKEAEAEKARAEAEAREAEQDAHST